MPEVEARVTGRDVVSWAAYFKVKAEKEAAAYEKARRESERK